jgi:hypothetical protein
MYHTDRIRIGSVAAMLSTILAVHQTQAQNAPRQLDVSHRVLSVRVGA